MSKRGKDIANQPDELELELDTSMDLQEEETLEAQDDAQDEDLPEGSKNRRRGLMTSLLNNEGESNVTNFRDLFRSIDLNGEWFRRNLFFIVLVTGCLLLFVTNRYQAQLEQIEEANLKNELAEMKYKWLTRFSELTTSTRQSQIEEQLRENGETDLSHSKQPPFLIRAKKNK
ncbi:MAG: hypothetical protein MJZ35_01390 [Bacteroidaceae bacterium]|nr:hypothetical protein [Bacteroidaceae bacterium]